MSPAEGMNTLSGSLCETTVIGTMHIMTLMSCATRVPLFFLPESAAAIPPGPSDFRRPSDFRGPPSATVAVLS